jgi:hypothetical protein
MANQEKQQGGQNEQRATPERRPYDRSENLLPVGTDGNRADGAAEEDSRFEVSEEVNLDQQSDSTRRVGQAPKGIAGDALADSLKTDQSKGGKA